MTAEPVESGSRHGPNVRLCGETAYLRTLDFNMCGQLSCGFAVYPVLVAFLVYLVHVIPEGFFFFFFACNLISRV